MCDLQISVPSDGNIQMESPSSSSGAQITIDVPSNVEVFVPDPNGLPVQLDFLNENINIEVANSGGNQFHVPLLPGVIILNTSDTIEVTIPSRFFVVFP